MVCTCWLLISSVLTCDNFAPKLTVLGVAGALGVRVVSPVMEGHNNDNDNVPTHHHPVEEQHALEQQQILDIVTHNLVLVS